MRNQYDVALIDKWSALIVSLLALLLWLVVLKPAAEEAAVKAFLEQQKKQGLCLRQNAKGLGLDDFESCK